MDAPLSRLQRKTTHIVSSSGRVGNEHFLLTADHLLLELDSSNFELVSAIAEGHLQIHLLDGGREAGCMVQARSAVYQVTRQRLVLNGWEETHWHGMVEAAPVDFQREVVLPTDGTFLPSAPDEPEIEVTKDSQWLQAA